MRVQVKVKANCKTEEVSQEGNTFIVKVKEPPKQGKANRALIKVLAQHLGVPKSQVRLISGFTGKDKVIEIVEG